MKNSRVSALALAAATFGLALGAPAKAQQVEWSDRFDSVATRAGEVNQQSSPILGEHAVPALTQAIAQYEGIVAQGGWPHVPAAATLKIGSNDPSVSVLRRRLMVSGDLATSAGVSTVFDTYVDAAVRRFQTRHGIKPDGVVGGETLNQLNVPAAVRLQQLRTNLVRLSAYSGPLGSRYVVVNVPGAEIETVEFGSVVSRHGGVVGKVDRQTPLLTSTIHEINFNPFWTVPKSIIRKDLIPKMQSEPDYLTRYKIRIYDQSGREIDPMQVNWNTDEAVSYMFRQDPGEINSLGNVRMNFHNPHQVYLHDTPAKSLFAENARFHSSGCVRVQNVREFVAWVLKDTPGWSREQIDAVIRSGERINANVVNAPALYTVYLTGWANTDGTVQFRPDVYDRDGLQQTAQVQ
jgi:murein L,D-transpeptidase YcbB/YkuD